MSFYWSEYLDLADELLEEGKGTPRNEAKLRSAISRAYYAVYNTADKYAASKGIRGFHRTRGGSRHKDLIKRFLESRAKGHKQLGSNLNRLHNQRIDADYHFNYRSSRDLTFQAKTSVSQARTTLKLITSLP